MWLRQRLQIYVLRPTTPNGSTHSHYNGKVVHNISESLKGIRGCRKTDNTVLNSCYTKDIKFARRYLYLCVSVMLSFSVILPIMFNLYIKSTNVSLSLTWYFVSAGQRIYAYTSHIGFQVLCTPLC